VTRRLWLCALACVGGLGCNARPPVPVHGIELEDPQERARAAEAPRPPAADAGPAPGSAFIASASQAPADPAEADDSAFVYSRQPPSEQERLVALIPIHIQEAWWPFRAPHLGISEGEAQKRDAQLSQTRAPAGFWDAQTALEAVSVWTVLCNECHGGRRSTEDAREMPNPQATWGQGEGYFFGNRKKYREMFATVRNGGPIRESGRAEMPPWRNIL
jgi:hypothetical protein